MRELLKSCFSRKNMWELVKDILAMLVIGLCVFFTIELLVLMASVMNYHP